MLLKESRLCVFDKEGMRNGLHFKKGKGSVSDLQAAVSGCQNKSMCTENDTKVFG